MYGSHLETFCNTDAIVNAQKTAPKKTEVTRALFIAQYMVRNDAMHIELFRCLGAKSSA